MKELVGTNRPTNLNLECVLFKLFKFRNFTRDNGQINNWIFLKSGFCAKLEINFKIGCVIFAQG